MVIELHTPRASQLEDVDQALRSWQREGAPIQLHPGDLGWKWRSGAAEVAATMRIWSRDGAILAIGYLDSPDVLRVTVAPEAWRDDKLAVRVVADLSAPEHAILPTGKVAVEVPDGTRLTELLAADAWSSGEAWTPLRLDLSSPLGDPQLRVELVQAAEQVSECTAVHRSAWGNGHFTDTRWRAMADGTPFADARCLLARNDDDVAVATVTVWSAGPGKPGLIEPLGVHLDHRRRGYGTAVCVAAGAHLRAMGSLSAWVCTPSSLHSAVATYEAAGFERQPEQFDLCRDA